MAAMSFTAGFPGMMMVLSDMSHLEQMEDNLSFLSDFNSLNETEMAAVKKGPEDLRQQEPDPLHRRPPEAHPHPRPLRRHEHQADTTGTRLLL